MKKIAAHTVSVLFHPVFAPVLGLLLIFNSGTYLAYLPYEAKKVIFLIVLLNTVVIPLTLLPLFYYRKYIQGITMEKRRERVVPLLVAAALYYIAYYLLARLQVSGLIKSFVQVSALVVVIAIPISWFWKISLHMIGLGGLTGLLLAMMFKLSASLAGMLVILVLITGMVGTARLYLDEHRPLEVYAGYFLGLGLMTGLLLL